MSVPGDSAVPAEAVRPADGPPADGLAQDGLAQDGLAQDGLAGAERAEAVEVTAFWRGLGLPGLIDVHVHFMP